MTTPLPPEDEVLDVPRDALEHALATLQAVLDATADGILVVDREGSIVSYNLRFVDMWRLPESVVATRDDDQGTGQPSGAQTRITG